MSFLNGTDPGLRQTRTPTVDLFTAGVDFTAGSSTQVTLTDDPGSENNVIITFDGIVQHRDTYSISGAVATFDAAIPTGVTDVEATYTTTQPASEPADNSVTLAKLSDGTQGGLIYYASGGAPTELAAGTSGYFLQTQGAGSNPVWAEAGGGGWEFVSSQTASSDATIDFTGLTSGYDYQFQINNLQLSSDGGMGLQFGTGAGPSYQSSSYHHQMSSGYGAIEHAEDFSSQSQLQFFHGGTLGGAAGELQNIRIEVFDPATSQRTWAMWQLAGFHDTPSGLVLIGGGYRDADDVVTAVRFIRPSGTFTSGKFSIYRRANA